MVILESGLAVAGVLIVLAALVLVVIPVAIKGYKRYCEAIEKA